MPRNHPIEPNNLVHVDGAMGADVGLGTVTKIKNKKYQAICNVP
jgi:hypothetical protein